MIVSGRVIVRTSSPLAGWILSVAVPAAVAAGPCRRAVKLILTVWGGSLASFLPCQDRSAGPGLRRSGSVERRHLRQCHNLPESASRPDAAGHVPTLPPSPRADMAASFGSAPLPPLPGRQCREATPPDLGKPRGLPRPCDPSTRRRRAAHASAPIANREKRQDRIPVDVDDGEASHPCRGGSLIVPMPILPRAAAICMLEGKALRSKPARDSPRNTPRGNPRS